MPTALDTKFRATAQALLGKFGAPCTYGSLNPETYDATSGTTVATYTRFTVPAMLASAGRRFRLPEEVRADASAVLVAASAMPVTPKVGDVIVVDGTERRVTSANPTYSGEQVALWSLNVES